MSPVTHLLLGWLVAESCPGLSRRERFLVTAAGVVPDLDGLGAAVELATRDSEKPLLWFSEYHHLLHNALFCAAVVLLAAALSRRRWAVGLLTAAAFHLHMLCDLVGARGPDGAQWPVPYLSPFSEARFSWAHQWELNAWPNFLITGGALVATAALARRRGYSVVSLFSEAADRKFVEALRRRFPLKGSAPLAT